MAACSSETPDEQPGEDASATGDAATSQEDTPDGSEENSPGDSEAGNDPETLESVSYMALAGGFSALIPEVVKLKEFDIEQGFELQISSAASPELPRALASGAADTVLIATAGLALSYTTMPTAKIIRPLYVNNHVLMVRPDSDIETIADLRGKRVSEISQTATGQAALALLAEEAGLNLETDVNISFVAPAVGMSGVENGDLDAAAGWAPLTTRLAEQGKLKVGVDLNQVWNETFPAPLLSGSIVAKSEWIDANPDLAKAVSTAFGKAIQALVDDPTIFDNENIQEAFGIDPEQNVAAVREEVITRLVTTWSESDVTEQVEYLMNTIELPGYEDTSVTREQIEGVFDATVQLWE